MPKTLVKARQAGRYSKVFDLIRRNNGQLSRFDICKLTGYSTTTVTAVVDRLISDGLVVEDESQESRVGRRPSLLNIQRDGMYFMGIECNATGVNLTVADVSQAIFFQHSVELEATCTEQILETITAQINRFVQENPTIWNKIRSVTFSIPGKLDAQSGVGEQYRTLADWRNVDFRARFSYLGKQLLFLNNVDAMLVGYRTEQKLGPDESVMFVCIRNGVGVRLFSKGVLCSELGVVCELGHVKAEGSTRLCACGKKGCFDAELSTAALVGKLREAYELGQLDRVGVPNPEALTLDTLFHLVEQGEPTAVRMVAEAGEYLVQMLQIMLGIFRPDIVVLSSIYPETVCHFGDMLRDRLADHLEELPQITCIPPANALASFGAAVVGYETAFPSKVMEF